jgi:hypothetical protein
MIAGCKNDSAQYGVILCSENTVGMRAKSSTVQPSSKKDVARWGTFATLENWQQRKRLALLARGLLQLTPAVLARSICALQAEPTWSTVHLFTSFKEYRQH